MKLKRPLWYYLLPLLSLGLLLAGWLYMAAAKPLLFPSPAETWQRLIKLIEVPLARVPLYQHILISLRRVLLAVLAACVLGVAFGLMVGWSRTFKATLGSIFEILRPIPPIAWIPLIILWYGIGETSKVVVIAIAAFFPITLNTLGGFQSLPSGYLEVARLYRLGVSETFRKVYLPNALPQILVGLKLGLGSSWMAVVAAELIAANSGIGYRLSYSRGLLRSDAVILCMLVIGLVGILMDKLLTALFRRLLPWQKKA